MNRILNLVDRLLAKGRNLQNAGYRDNALHLFDRLSRFRTLPAGVNRETRLRLVQLHCAKRKYRRARRLLAPLLLAYPNKPRYRLLMAKLAAADVTCDPRRALYHFRHCLQQAPNNVRALLAFGNFAYRNGKHRSALRLLRRAYRLAPENGLVLQRYLRVLQRLNRFKEMDCVLRQNRFRLGKAPWFQKTQDDCAIVKLRRRQQKERLNQSGRTKEPLCLLAFPKRIESSNTGISTGLFRDDAPSVLNGPHLGRSLPRPDQRRAQ